MIPAAWGMAEPNLPADWRELAEGYEAGLRDHRVALLPGAKEAV